MHGTKSETVRAFGVRKRSMKLLEMSKLEVSDQRASNAYPVHASTNGSSGLSAVAEEEAIVPSMRGALSTSTAAVSSDIAGPNACLVPAASRSASSSAHLMRKEIKAAAKHRASGPMLQQKAKNFALILGAENFNASSGWLQRFKAHFNIVGKTVSGESEDANEEEIKKWLDQEWPQVVAKYALHQIFNADETGLFWYMLPRQTLDTHGDTCHGGKQGKARVTVLLAANMDGSTKLRPLVIGKFQTPRTGMPSTDCYVTIFTKPANVQ